MFRGLFKGAAVVVGVVAAVGCGGKGHDHFGGGSNGASVSGSGGGTSGASGSGAGGDFHCDYQQAGYEYCYSYTGLTAEETTLEQSACSAFPGSSTPASCPTANQSGCCENVTQAGITFGYCLYDVPGVALGALKTACETATGTWSAGGASGGSSGSGSSGGSGGSAGFGGSGSGSSGSSGFGSSSGSSGGFGESSGSSGSSGGSGDGSCGLMGSAAACQSCCDGNHTTGANELSTYEQVCLCTSPGACATECGSSYCAGSAPSSACITCADTAFGSTGACITPVSDDCSASPDCTALLTCYSSECAGLP